MAQNLVEFLVRIKDLASGPLQKLGNTGQNAFTKIGNTMDKIGGKTGKLAMNIRDIDLKLDSLKKTREIRFDDSQIRRINKEIDGLQAKKERLEGGKSGYGIGGMLRSGLAIAGIGSLAFLGKDIMQAGIERQMSQTALETLLGKQNGDTINSQLLKFAKDSIYGNEVFNEGKLMAGSGVKSDRIMHVLNMIGDIGMGDKERMKSLALAFSEANTRGSLTGINERMFLQGGLFNPIEQLHKMTGESLPALKKDMEKGKISIDMLIKAMEYATGPMGRWHDMMQKMQETPAGKWTAFEGTIRTLAGTIGIKLLPVLGKVADFMTALLNNRIALYQIAIAIGAMTTAWLAYTAVTKAAAIWTFVLEAFASPWLAIAGIGLVSAAIGGLILSHNKLGSNVPPVLDGLIKKTDSYGNSATNAANNVTTAAGRIEDANNRMAKSSLIIDDINKFQADKANKKRLEDLAFTREMAFVKLHGSISDKDIVKIKTQVGIPGYAIDKKDAPEGAASGGVLGSDTTNTITGGGVRNITINVAKFQDKTEIHTVGLKEGIQEVEEIMRDMFLRVTNSAATAMS